MGEEATTSLASWVPLSEATGFALYCVSLRSPVISTGPVPLPGIRQGGAGLGWGGAEGGEAPKM